VPIFPNFDNSQSTTPCTGLQVLKVTQLDIPYSALINDPVTFAFTIQPTVGPRRCNTWPELLNTTNTNEPYPFTFFSADNDCCLLPKPPPPPPPSPPPSNGIL